MVTMCAKRPMASARSRCCRRAADRPLDVAFIDIGLPGGMDGYELARRIRNLPTGREVRLVALTGYGFPEDRQQSEARRIRAASRETRGARGAAARAQRRHPPLMGTLPIS